MGLQPSPYLSQVHRLLHPQRRTFLSSLHLPRNFKLLLPKEGVLLSLPRKVYNAQVGASRRFAGPGLPSLRPTSRNQVTRQYEPGQSANAPGSATEDSWKGRSSDEMERRGGSVESGGAGGGACGVGMVPSACSGSARGGAPREHRGGPRTSPVTCLPRAAAGGAALLLRSLLGFLAQGSVPNGPPRTNPQSRKSPRRRPQCPWRFTPRGEDGVAASTQSS